MTGMTQMLMGHRKVDSANGPINYEQAYIAPGNNLETEVRWQFMTDGSLFKMEGSGNWILWGTWETGTGTPTDYEGRANLVSGVTPTGSSLDTWINIGTSGFYFQILDTSSIDKECAVDYWIRRASSGETVFSGSFSLKINRP